MGGLSEFHIPRMHPVGDPTHARDNAATPARELEPIGKLAAQTLRMVSCTNSKRKWYIITMESILALSAVIGPSRLLSRNN